MACQRRDSEIQTNIKGAKIGEFGKVNGNSFLREQVSSDVSRNRISEKLSVVDSILQDSKN